MDKYKNKNRVLLINTPDYDNKKYKDAVKEYNNNIYELHKRYLILRVRKDNIFSINLIGFDGKVKKKYDKINIKDIKKTIDAMPMGKLVNPKQLSLYADYRIDTTIKDLGFKNKEKAYYTLNRIKKLDKTKQMNIVNVMINRAKYHPHKNKDMEEAINIFENWKIGKKK